MDRLEQSLSPADAQLQALWLEARGGNAGARERLIERYQGFARIMAAKSFARRVNDESEFDDYLQYARIGLIESVDRFDAGRGIKFETFAAVRITGAILNGLASSSELQRQLATRRSILSERVASLRDEGAAPDGDVFAQLADIAVGMALGFMLEETGMYRDGERAGIDDCYAGLEMRQLQEQVRSALKELQGNRAVVIGYHYLQQIPFEQIATMLGLSKGRIAQLHREALGTMRERLRGTALDTRF